MLLLLRYELLKTYRKLRTYIGFGLILTLIPLAYWGFSFGGENMVNNMTRGLQNDFVFFGTLFNGWFVSQFVMGSLFVHIPFLIVLVAGDMFAGEATGGTFRMLLSRPPSRTHIFLIKAVTAVIYTFSLVIFLLIISVSLGLILFGSGDLISFQESMIAILPAKDLWWRFILGYTLAGVSMSVVASLALLFSSIVENAIGPIVGSMAVVILFLILGNLPFEFFEQLRPYLFTTYMNVWSHAFADPIEWETITGEASYLAIFFALFLSSAWMIFTRKDILS